MTDSAGVGLTERNTRQFWRTVLALFAAGFATFALLYCVQPLMPLFSAGFGLAAAESSLVLSVTTLGLAFCMLAASALSDRAGRRPVMAGSLLSSGLLCAACAAAPGFFSLVGLRAAMGVSLSGLPAVAMAYVAEEMAPEAAGLAMGLYIGGSAIGGMSGRLAASVIAAEWGWRAALLVCGAAGMICAALLWRYLPPSRHFHPHARGGASILRVFAQHLRRPVLPWLFAEGFLLMGAFVSAYNYIEYRLLSAPFRLPQATVGLIFSVYLVGVVSSTVMGGLAVRLGRRRVVAVNLCVMLMGVALTVSGSVPVIVAGVALLTAGFFGAHSVASAWVGWLAGTARAQASALYLFAYYMGSSVIGSGSGVLYARAGWSGLAAGLGLLVLLALAIAAAKLGGRAEDTAMGRLV